MAATAYQNTQITQLYVALFNRAPDAQGLAYWADQLVAGKTVSQVCVDMYNVAPARAYYPLTLSNEQIIDAFYTNILGRVPDAGGKAYWTNELATKSVGQVISTLVATVALYSGSDPLGLKSQALFNNKVLVGDHFAQILQSNDINLANIALVGVTSDAASVNAVEASNTSAVSPVNAGGQTYNLTTFADTGLAFTGTAFNDTFAGTYDAAVTDTFSADDRLIGNDGVDTLRISHFLDVAITPPDTLWTGVRGIEKVVMQTTGNGAQTLVTGLAFEAAFHGNGIMGVDLSTTTSGTGAINVDMSSFGGSTALTTTSIAGAQTVISGKGAATVTASSGAGALTIKGEGLSTVFATTTGGGAQTIGDAGGNGVSLVSVVAIANSGTQTITSTSTNAVTVNATSISGIQIIDTGAGADIVVAKAAAGTNNRISTGGGNDTIFSGLGNDVITGGLGADTMTGGGGADTFVIGANGSIVGISMDTITDFSIAGADILDFGATTTVRTADASTLLAGTNVQTSAGGLVVFHPSDSSLALKVSAIQADTQLNVAGSVAMFIDGGNTYVFYAGTAPGNGDDQMIQLSGLTTLTSISGGAVTTII